MGRVRVEPLCPHVSLRWERPLRLCWCPARPDGLLAIGAATPAGARVATRTLTPDE